MLYMNWKSSHPNVLYCFVYLSVSWAISVVPMHSKLTVADNQNRLAEVGSDSTIALGDTQSKTAATKSNKDEGGKEEKEEETEVEEIATKRVGCP